MRTLLEQRKERKGGGRSGGGGKAAPKVSKGGDRELHAKMFEGREAEERRVPYVKPAQRLLETSLAFPQKMVSAAIGRYWLLSSVKR